jgi:hypothetical protein
LQLIDCGVVIVVFIDVCLDIFLDDSESAYRDLPTRVLPVLQLVADNWHYLKFSDEGVHLCWF